MLLVTSPLVAVHVYVPALSTETIVKLNPPPIVLLYWVNSTLLELAVVFEGVIVMLSGLPFAVQLTTKLEPVGNSCQSESLEVFWSNVMSTQLKQLKYQRYNIDHKLFLQT